MKNLLFLSLTCLLFTFSCSNSDVFESEISPQENLQVETNNPVPAATERDQGNSAAVEFCKEILPFRPDFNNLGQCVKLFVVCGDFERDAPNYPVCICEVFELNGLLSIFGYENYGQCVSNFE